MASNMNADFNTSIQDLLQIIDTMIKHNSITEDSSVRDLQNMMRQLISQ